MARSDFRPWKSLVHRVVQPQWLSYRGILRGKIDGRRIAAAKKYADAFAANGRRLQILDWLRSPTEHFPPQLDGDLVKDGVCGILIARKLGVSQPTVSEHLKILSQAGLIRGKRIKQWTFYRRDEAKIKDLKTRILARI